MARYLATFSDLLGDIEINGFVTMTDNEMKRFEELANSITWDFHYNVGGKRLMYSSGEDLLSKIDYREISNEEQKIFKKLFNNKFGTFISEEYLESLTSEDQDEEPLDEDDSDDWGPRFRDDDDDDDN